MLVQNHMCRKPPILTLSIPCCCKADCSVNYITAALISTSSAWNRKFQHPSGWRLGKDS